MPRRRKDQGSAAPPGDPDTEDAAGGAAGVRPREGGKRRQGPRAGQGKRKAASRKGPDVVPWPVWLRGWGAVVAVAAVVAVVAWVGYALFVSLSNGTLVRLDLEVGTDPEGSMFLRCAASSDASVCPAGGANITLQVRDRVHVTVTSLDAAHHHVRLVGAAYGLWPAGFEAHLEGVGDTETTAFTAWAAGTYEVACLVDGHGEAGMRATLLVG